MIKYFLAIALLVLTVSIPAESGDMKYVRYKNVRFGFDISYPLGILIPQGEPDNGDGQRFLSKDRTVEMVVYGYNNALDETLKGLYAEESRNRTKKHPDKVVIYKILKKDWFVVSGTEGDKLFYKKVLYRDNQFIHFNITYPKTKRDPFDSITKQIVKSLIWHPNPFDERAHDRTIERSTAALKKNPKDARALIDRGFSYYCKDLHDRAIQDYDAALKIKPDDYETLRYRGSAYRAKGNYDQAVRDYSAALKIKPDDYVALDNRGNLYWQKGLHERAFEDWSASLRVKPDLFPALRTRGDAYHATGSYDRAIEDYSAALKMEPDDYEILIRRGDAYLYEGFYDQAIEDYSMAHLLRPYDFEALLHRGRAYLYHAGKKRKALADFEAMASLNSSEEITSFSLLWLCIARAHGGQSCQKELNNNIGDRLHRDPWPEPLLYLFRGSKSPEMVFAEASKAKGELRKQRLCETYFYMGQYYLLQGNKGAAARKFRQSVSMCDKSDLEYDAARMELKTLEN